MDIVANQNSQQPVALHDRLTTAGPQLGGSGGTRRDLVDQLKQDIRRAVDGEPAALRRLQTFAQQNPRALERLQNLVGEGAPPVNNAGAMRPGPQPAPPGNQARDVGAPKDQLPPQLLELLKMLVQLLAGPRQPPGESQATPAGGPATAGPRAAPTAGPVAAKPRAAPTGAATQAPPTTSSGATAASGGPARVPSAVPTGRSSSGDFLRAALAQKGDRYVFGAETRLNDPNPNTFDCSELVQWAAHQAGVTVPDGSANQLAHVRKHGSEISVAQALKTPGALLFRPGHVAISLGDGRTIEARGRKHGVGVFNANGRFTHAGLIPGMRH